MFDILLKNSELYGMQLNIYIIKKIFFKNFFFVYIPLILISFFSVYSCKKEKENKPPEISIQLPQSEISLNAIDSVLVNASVTDDNGPLTVSVFISDAQANPLTSNLVKTSSGNTLNINQYFFYKNKYIETGIYYLAIRVSDGENVVNKFVKINITGIPKKLNSIYVGVDDPSGLKVFCSDTTGNFSQVGFVASDIIDFVINNYSEQLYILKYNGNLACYSLPEFQLEWERTGLNLLGNTYNGQLKEYNHYIYVTDAKGYIKAFDDLGIVKNVYSTSLGSPVYFNFCDSKPMVYVNNYNNQNKYIQTLTASGGILHTHLVSFIPYRFFQFSFNHVFVFGGRQNITNMSIYNTEISYLDSFGTDLQGHFHDAIETPDDKYLVATANDIHTIDKDYGYATTYALGHKADKMKFEELSQALYASDSNNFSGYLYPNSQIISSHDFLQRILFFDFWYNK